MAKSNFNRRKFLRDTAATVGGMSIFSALPEKIFAAGSSSETSISKTPPKKFADPRIKFSVIGINHSHINSQVDAVIRGGGQLVSLYAKEPDLVATFAKRYPQVKVVASEKEILED